VPTRRSTADRLLDAQVAYFLAELDDDRIADTLARAVDDLLGMARRMRLADVVDADTVKEIVTRVVNAVAASADAPQLIGAISDAWYDLETSGDYLLGELVDRDPVEALIAHLLGLRRLQDRAMERFTESPLVGVVAAKFMTTVLNDFVQQNRQRAEKLPGMASLLSLGQSAASRMPGMTVLGDAAGKSAQFAVRRTNGAMREMMRDAPIQDAAMELWDLHADEPIGDLRAYLSKQELRTLVLLVHDLVVSGSDSQFSADLLSATVDVVFAQFGDRDLAALLADLGLGRDELVGDLRRLVPPILAAVRADGTLEAAIRSRLEPFFASPEVKAIVKPAPRPS
jgi:hypothetical protein